MATLSCICDDYCAIHALVWGAEYLLRHTAKLYGEYLRRPATSDDLTDLAVSGWIRSLEGRRSPWTIAGHRTRLLCLWRFANRRGLVAPPGEVRLARPPEPQPDSWSVLDVQALIRAAAEVDPSGYLELLAIVAWETGLRKADCQRLARWQISPDGSLRGVRQHKTAWPIEPRLRPRTAEEVLRRSGDYPLRCTWGSRRYCRLWREVRQLAGVTGRGACQKLRRSSATAIAAEFGEDVARRHLGHRSTEMLRHYLDRTRLPLSVPLPPDVRSA